MPAEEFTVIWNLQNAGDATAGYKFEQTNQAHPVKGFGPVETARVTVVTAESPEEAIKGVRQAYGESLASGEFKVAKTSSVETKKA